MNTSSTQCPRDFLTARSSPGHIVTSFSFAQDLVEVKRHIFSDDVKSSIFVEVPEKASVIAILVQETSHFIFIFWSELLQVLS